MLRAQSFARSTAVFLLALFLGLGAAWATGPQKVNLYSYYDYPPFVTASGRGLTFDLAEHLTQRSQGRYAFVPVILPRRRLDSTVAVPLWDGVVAWAVPEFFGDSGRMRFEWTGAFETDSDLLISHKDLPITMATMDTHQGLRFGGMLGHLYPNFDSQFERGTLVREDAPTLNNNLSKLLLKRIDVTLISASSLDYFRSVMLDLSQNVYLDPKPLKVFERRMMVAKGNQELFQFVAAAVTAMPTDKAWKHLRGQYR